MNDINLTTIIVALGGGLLTYLGTRVSSKATMDKVNFKNANGLFDEYKGMVSDLKKQVEKMQKEIDNLRDKYDKDISYYQEEIKKLRNNNTELTNKILAMKEGK